MNITLDNFEAKVQAAVKSFWQNRESAKKNQKKSGKKDQGERGSVTAGKNMTKFVNLAMDIVKANGLADAKILHHGRVLTLPGYFRPTKLWDLLIIDNNKLIAALEFKSQVGSFGNNFNNRTEEAIGAGVDFWTAFREGAFGSQFQPFLGWVILLEDSPDSRSPVNDASPNFNIFPDFKDASYAQRYNILCQKLVQKQIYSAASIILTDKKDKKSGKYSDINELTSLKTFFIAFAGHIATCAAQKAK